MNKIISILAFALSFTVVTSQSVKCPKGTVVYPFGTEKVIGLNATLEFCPPDNDCWFYKWNNTDIKTGERAYIETGFCAPADYKFSCEVLAKQDMVGLMEGCQETRCMAGQSCTASFKSTICNLGTVGYTLDKSLVVYNPKAGPGPCPVGKTCGMFNWENTINFTLYMETGECVNTEETNLCQNLTSHPDVKGRVDNCTFSSCEGNLCRKFEIAQPSNRGFRCDQGVFAFNLNRSKLLFADNVTSSPCSKGDACGMFQFINVDKEGNRSYVESGFCIPVQGIMNTTCEGLREYGVEKAENCSVKFCSGDLCQKFTHLKAPEGCPKRAHWDDIQILPKCTAKELLASTFMCLGPFVEKVPFANNETEMCNTALDSTVACLSSTLQRCVEPEQNGSAPCPSVLGHIEGIESLFQVINVVASVKSVEDIKGLLSQFNVTMNPEDLQAFDAICAGNHSAIMQSLMNATSALMGMSLNIGPPVCSDAMIVNDVIHWSLEMATDLLKAETHYDVCVSYDKMKVRMVDAVTNRCFNLEGVGPLLKTQIIPYYADLVQKGIDIAKEFLFKLDIPGCSAVPFPSHLVCHQGNVFYSVDKQITYDDSNATASVCPLGWNCGMFRFISTDHDNNTAYVESGFCNPPKFNVTCEVLHNETRIARLGECEVKSCSDENRCMKFKKDQCEEVEEDDIGVLPRCSLKKTLNKTFECMGPFVAGYPFSEQQQCRSEIDGMVRCLATTVGTCLSGDCPTFLDFIPGLREMYKNITKGALHAHTLGGALRLIPGMSDEIIEIVYSLICRETGTAVPDFIKQFIVNLPPIKIEQPLCSDDIVDQLIRIGFNAATAIFEARTHQDICTAFSTMKSQLTMTWKSQCDESKIPELLESSLGGALRGLIPIITKGINITNSFFENLQIPNCMGGGNMTTDCSRFYTMTSPCGMRQAWMCDYVSWKLHFLNVWFIRFNEYRSSNMMDPLPMPACPALSSDMCVDVRMMRCGSTTGCRICYCEDHRYKNVGKVMTMWREDYAHWKMTMMKYADVMAGSDQCGMM